MTAGVTMTVLEAFKPSVLLSESHFHYIKGGGSIADIVQRAAEEGFYSNLEIPVVTDAGERRGIENTVRKGELSLTQWLTPSMAAEGLSLCSLDEALRRKSVRRAIEMMAGSVECGAAAIGIASGPDPGGAAREEATGRLCESLCELGAAAGRSGGMRILLEPLDRDAHRNALIGPSPEVLSLIDHTRLDSSQIGLCWDSAHTALCGEDLIESLSMLRGHVGQIHIANAVLDRSDKNFGDLHMAIGSPGFMTVEKAGQVLRSCVSIGLFSERTVCVAVENRSDEGADPWATVNACGEILRQAWRIASDPDAGDREG